MEITVLRLMSESPVRDSPRPNDLAGSRSGNGVRLRRVVVQIGFLDLSHDLAATVMAARATNMMWQFQFAAIRAFVAGYRLQRVVRAAHVTFGPGLPVLLDSHVNPLSYARTGTAADPQVRKFPGYPIARQTLLSAAITNRYALAEPIGETRGGK
jgi:hypothetical protein